MLLRQGSNLYHSLNRRALYQLSYKGLVLRQGFEPRISGFKAQRVANYTSGDLFLNVLIL